MMMMTVIIADFDQYQAETLLCFESKNVHILTETPILQWQFKVKDARGQ